MLGKLIKYEFKNTAKVMGILFLAMIACTVAGTLALAGLNSEAGEQGVLGIICVTLMVVYVIGLIAVYILAYIYQCMTYYKTMYSAQGYLTHTLPAKESQILNAKLIVSSVWMLLITAVSVISVFAIICTGLRSNVIEMLSDSNNWNVLAAEFEMSFNMSIVSFFVWIIISTIVSVVSMLLFVYVSMAIGQLFNQHKVGFAVLAGFVIYMIEQILALVMMAVFGGQSTLVLVSSDMQTLNMAPIMAAGNILTIVITTAMYVGCLMINKKRLNLD